MHEPPGAGVTPVPLRPFCAELVARVERRRDEMVAAVAEAVRPSVPAELVDSLEWGVGEALEVFLRSLEEGRDLGHDEVARLQELSVPWAHCDAPLDAWRATISTAHDAAYRYLLDQARELATEIEDGVDSELVASALALHTRKFEARWWEAVAAGLAEGTAATDPGDPLERWLSGEVEVDDDAGSTTPDAPWALLVALEARLQQGDTGPARELQAGAHALAAHLPGAEVGAVRSSPCPHVVVAAPLGEDPWPQFVRRVARAAAESGLVVVAEPAVGPTGLGGVYRWVQRRLGAAGAVGRPGVVRATDLALALAAGQVDPDERCRDVHQVLGPVLARREDYARKDLETLVALVDCGGEVKAVASCLGISARRARGRLESVERRMGLRLSNPRDVVRLAWALHLWSTTEGMPPPGDAIWRARPRA